MMDELLSKPKSFLSSAPTLLTPVNRFATLGSLEQISELSAEQNMSKKSGLSKCSKLSKRSEIGHTSLETVHEETVSVKQDVSNAVPHALAYEKKSQESTSRAQADESGFFSFEQETPDEEKRGQQILQQIAPAALVEQNMNVPNIKQKKVVNETTAVAEIKKTPQIMINPFDANTIQKQ